MSGHRRFPKQARRWKQSSARGSNQSLSGIAPTAGCPPRRSCIICGHGCRGNTNWRRSSASGFGWTCPRPENRISQAGFGLWASIGISGAASGSIRVANSTRSARIPPTRAPNIAPIFPPTCKPLDAMNSAAMKTNAGTVSESVSQSNVRLRKILTV